MKISFKHQAIEKNNSPTCSVTEYALGHNMLDMAIATVSGRYPNERRVVNQECDELAYVFEGEGKLVLNNEEHKLSAGDVVLIEAGEIYFWEGDMKLFMSCRPAWNKEQHQFVD
jgi:uncharacterized cupin superfamily protein